MHSSKNGIGRLILIIAASVLFIAAILYFAVFPRSDPAAALVSELSVIGASMPNAGNALIDDAARSVVEFSPEGQMTTSFRSARLDINVSALDCTALTSGIEGEMQSILAEYVANADKKSDVYNENDSYRIELLEKAYDAALNSRLRDVSKYTLSRTVPAVMSYSAGDWSLDNSGDFAVLLITPESERPGFEAACEKLQHIDFHYSLPDWTSPVPEPKEEFFGVTSDPMEVQALIETPMAQRLINGQKLDWNKDKELIPGSSIHYYLDDSILSIVWQECEHGAVGTFAETIIGDASQLRRKLADDKYFKQIYYPPTKLAADANAVTAVSGDFYDHPDRIYGVHVYDGQVLGGSLINGQTCYFNDEGDMLFTYESRFSSMEEAQKYVDDNRIMFSLGFGPVIMENGVDVTPYDYPLGEVLDTYARCAIGQLGKLHYLCMTINCQSPDYYVYVTLRQAADSIIRHGCINAYTLDGGQTGSIIINDKLINPVQFGFEREQSDVVYFATAVPD